MPFGLGFTVSHFHDTLHLQVHPVFTCLSPNKATMLFMEMDYTLFMGFNNVCRKEKTFRKSLGYFTSHVVTLDRKNRRILVRIFVLHFLIFCLNDSEGWIR